MKLEVGKDEPPKPLECWAVLNPQGHAVEYVPTKEDAEWSANLLSPTGRYTIKHLREVTHEA